MPVRHTVEVFYPPTKGPTRISNGTKLLPAVHQTLTGAETQVDLERWIEQMMEWIEQYYGADKIGNQAKKKLGRTKGDLQIIVDWVALVLQLLDVKDAVYFVQKPDAGRSAKSTVRPALDGSEDFLELTKQANAVTHEWYARQHGNEHDHLHYVINPMNLAVRLVTPLL